MKTDNATSVNLRLFVARVLVELDVTNCYPDRVWLGHDKFGYVQVVEMEAFPQFCVRCKSLGHSDLNFPVLHPKHDVSSMKVANAALPPVDDGVRLPNVGPISNLANPTPFIGPLGYSYGSVVCGDIPVSVIPVGSLVDMIVDPLNNAPVVVPLMNVPIELISSEDLNAQVMGKCMDHNDWLDGSCSSQCGDLGAHVDPIDDVYNLEVGRIGQKAFGGGKRRS